MPKRFSFNKTVQDNQEQLFFVLERFVNVVKAKVEREDNDLVKEMLNDLDNFVRKFMALKNKNSEKFASLLWSKDFYKTYIEPKRVQNNLDKEEPRAAKNTKQLESQAALRLAFTAELEMEGFTKFLESYKKIWRCAYTNNNEEITRFVIYHLHWLLEEMTSKPENALFVKSLLNSITSLAYESIDDTPNRRDRSIYSSTIEWYTGIILHRFNRPDERFNLDYLEIFDSSLFTMLRYIIRKDKFDLFKHFVSSLISGSFLEGDDREIWDLTHYIAVPVQNSACTREKYKTLLDKLKELAESEIRLTSLSQLNIWTAQLDEIVGDIESNLLDEKRKSELKELEDKIKWNAESIFKYNNILEIVFMIGAYCIFEKKPRYIRYLWEYKEPRDSDAIWAGEDIVPNNLETILRVYFKTDIALSRFDYWEGHHGSVKYKQQYFLLLLARTLNKNNISANKDNHYSIPDFDINTYNLIEQSIEKLGKLKDELKENTNFLQELGFSKQAVDELFEHRLPDLLKDLKVSAQNKIKAAEETGKISEEKVKEFKAKVLQTFNGSAQIRAIFKYYGLYEDKNAEEYTNSQKRFGLNVVDQKAAFFENWHIGYLDWPENYGKSLASSEDALLLDEISKSCTKLETDQLDEPLSKFQDLTGIIIIATTFAFYNYFNELKNFKPKWRADGSHDSIKQFAGLFEVRGHNIPVFNVAKGNLPEALLILDTHKIGKLVQYSPLNKGESNSLLYDIFLVDIRAFSDDNDLLEKFVSEPPKWLQEIGDKEAQRKHLLVSVLVKIYERFEYLTGDDFKGFIIKLRKNRIFDEKGQ